MYGIEIFSFYSSLFIPYQFRIKMSTRKVGIFFFSFHDHFPSFFFPFFFLDILLLQNWRLLVALFVFLIVPTTCYETCVQSRFLFSSQPMRRDEVQMETFRKVCQGQMFIFAEEIWRKNNFRVFCECIMEIILCCVKDKLLKIHKIQEFLEKYEYSHKSVFLF